MIERDTSRPLSDAAASLLPGWRTHGQILELLDANLAVFGRESRRCWTTGWTTPGFAMGPRSWENCRGTRMPSWMIWQP